MASDNFWWIERVDDEKTFVVPEFFDNFAEQSVGDYTYYIRANYWRYEDESLCIASTDYFDITVTDVGENVK